MSSTDYRDVRLFELYGDEEIFGIPLKMVARDLNRLHEAEELLKDVRETWKGGTLKQHNDLIIGYVDPFVDKGESYGPE